MLSENEDSRNVRDFITQYAEKEGFTNTLHALTAVTDYLNACERVGDADIHYNHCLHVAQTILDLNPGITHDEEDICLALALVHVIPECFRHTKLDDALQNTYGLDPRIVSLLKVVVRDGAQTSEEQAAYYRAIRDDKLATIVKLADRSVLVSRLHRFSIWRSREFIDETRKFFFPLCIHAREVYPDCYGAISILMEKMRSLIDATEILMERYEQREKEYNREIIELQEENARIRSIIKALKEEQ